MKAFEHERHDWIIILIILLIGFLWVIAAGQWALRFPPSRKLNANMESNLDPNSDFLTRRPAGFIEPVDPSILTQPVWINVFLTPGAAFPTGTPMPATAGTSFADATMTQIFMRSVTPTAVAYATKTSVFTPTPTKPFIYYPASPTSTPNRGPSSTSAATSTLTFTPTTSPTSTATSTPTNTLTDTPTSTPTDTPTPTATHTSDPSEPDFGAPDGNAATLGNGMSVEFNLSGFLLDGNTSWDVVYYEKEETSSSGKIHLGAVLIEVYDQSTTSWYTIYQWGDGSADANASYTNGNSEPDGFPVDTSLLYGVSPLNTGIAIDIDAPTIGQGASIGDLITRIRITSLSIANCDIDALQMLR